MRFIRVRRRSKCGCRMRPRSGESSGKAGSAACSTERWKVATSTYKPGEVCFTPWRSGGGFPMRIRRRTVRIRAARRRRPSMRRGSRAWCTYWTPLAGLAGGGKRAKTELPVRPVKDYGRGRWRPPPPPPAPPKTDESRGRRVRTVRRWADSRARSGRLGRGAASSSAAHGGAAGPLKLDRVSFQRSGVDNASGAEGDVGAIQLAIFDRDGRVATTAAAATAALNGSAEGISILPETEDLVSSAAESAAAAASGSSHRRGSPEARDARSRRDLALPNRHLRPKLDSFRGDGDASGRQSRRTGFHGEIPRYLGGLHQGHAKAGKSLTRTALIGFVVGRVAVPNADHFALAGNPEVHLVAGYRHAAALRVLHLDREHRHVLAIGQNFFSVCCEHEFRRRSGGLAPGRHHLLAVFVSPRLDRAGSVLDVPRQV